MQDELHRQALIGRGVGRWALPRALWLECVRADPWTFRVGLVEEKVSLPDRPAQTEVSLEFDPEDVDLLEATLTELPSPQRVFQVSLRSAVFRRLEIIAEATKRLT